MKVYCLIRGKTNNDSTKKLKELLHFYFGSKHDEDINTRIIVLSGDITSEKFGLSQNDYLNLAEEIDTVIHSAAIVKHFGDYSKFLEINVNGTKKIAEFSNNFNITMYLISTLSVAGESNSDLDNGTIFTENDLYIGQDYLSNVYVRSKFEAETAMLTEIKKGLNGYILRVGNLTGRYSDGQFQKNIEENRFYNAIKSISNIGIITERLLEHKLEFTPVDLCSKAIVNLCNEVGKKGKIFHVFNHNRIPISSLKEFLTVRGIELIETDTESFVEFLKSLSANDKQNILSGIVNEWDMNTGFFREESINITSDVTVKILKENGFIWPIINHEYLKKIFDYADEVGFFVDKINMANSYVKVNIDDYEMGG